MPEPAQPRFTVQASRHVTTWLAEQGASLVGPHHPHLALRRSRLAQRAARAALGHPEHRLHMPHASTAALGA